MNRTAPLDFNEYVERFLPRVQAALAADARRDPQSRARGKGKDQLRDSCIYSEWDAGVVRRPQKPHRPVSARVSDKGFKKELSRYKTAKGSVQFPFDRPLPLTLVGRIVKFRVKENQDKK